MIPIERLYELGLELEREHPDLEGEPWEKRLRAAVEAEVGPVSDDEFVAEAARLFRFLDRRIERLDARDRIVEVYESVAPLTAEYNSLVDQLVVASGTKDEPIAALIKGRVVALFDTLDAIDLRRFDALLARLLAAQSEAERIAAPFPELRSIVDTPNVPTIRAIHAALVEKRTAEGRQARLSARADARPAGTVPADRRCACGKIARVGDLCKRHARDAGLLPHGKIGEEL